MVGTLRFAHPTKLNDVILRCERSKPRRMTTLRPILRDAMRAQIMSESSKYRWRKATDVNRDGALFELLEDNNAVLDVGFTNDGSFEVAFNPSIGGMVIEWDQFLK